MELKLSRGSISSLIYHNQYDYPMTLQELTRWSKGLTLKGAEGGPAERKVRPYKTADGYYFLKGREKLVAIRQKREVASAKKFQLLQTYLPIFEKIPTILFVGVTGSLAMMNSDSESDIDLMIITRKNTLWISRLIILIILIILKIPMRRAGNREEKDKLCLNLWLDETVLVWPTSERNIFTAHEIAQVIPVVNKHQTYERFINGNRWILEFWPKVVKTRSTNFETRKETSDFVFSVLNFCAFQAQLWYMKSKITTEVVSPHCALFHPKTKR